MSHPPLPSLVSVWRGPLSGCGATFILLYMSRNATTIKGLEGTSFFCPAISMIITSLL